MPDLRDILANPWAYMPPRSSLWLWIGAPLIVALIYLITSRGQAARSKRLREAEIWRASIAPEPASKKGKARSDSDRQKKPAGPPRVMSLPAALHGALLSVGGGEAVAHFELVRGLAYLSLMEASGLAGSDHQTVTMRLEHGGPDFTARPLPVIEGTPAPNTGVQFKRDPELMSKFIIEGSDAKGIGRWLSAPLRRALCDMPAAWLQVRGGVMTLTVFGTLEADQIDALVEAADTFFAEHGAGEGASLFGGHGAEPEPAAEAAPKKKVKAQAAALATLAETPRAKKKG